MSTTAAALAEDENREPATGPRESRWWVNLLSGLIVTAPVGFLVISVATGAIFVMGWDGGVAVLLGAVAGGAAWLVMGAFAILFLGVDRANRSIHKELANRMDAMSAGPMPESSMSQLHALARELGVTLVSASDDARERLISQLQNPPR